MASSINDIPTRDELIDYLYAIRILMSYRLLYIKEYEPKSNGLTYCGCYDKLQKFKTIVDEFNNKYPCNSLQLHTLDLIINGRYNKH